MNGRECEREKYNGRSRTEHNTNSQTIWIWHKQAADGDWNYKEFPVAEELKEAKASAVEGNSSTFCFILNPV